MTAIPDDLAVNTAFYAELDPMNGMETDNVIQQLNGILRSTLHGVAEQAMLPPSQQRILKRCRISRNLTTHRGWAGAGAEPAASPPSMQLTRRLSLRGGLLALERKSVGEWRIGACDWSRVNAGRMGRDLLHSIINTNPSSLCILTSSVRRLFAVCVLPNQAPSSSKYGSQLPPSHRRRAPAW
jgi:hypothetical protein